MRASGAVAFFDILGYKEFLRNSPCDEAAALVVNGIAEAKADVVSYLKKKSRGGRDADEFMQHVRAVTWVVFSDTLLLLCPFESSMAPREAARRWHVFILSAQVLSKHMFEVGLPLRGCVAYGHFIQEKNCFAGKVILDAYEGAESLQLATTVFHHSAYIELLRAVEPFALQQDVTAKILLVGSLLEYPVPMRLVTQKVRTMNFLVVTGISKDPSAWVGNSKEIVLRSFSKHNKTMGESAQLKAENTATYLAFLEATFPGTLSQQ